MDEGFFRCNSFWNIGCPLGSVVSTTTGAGGGTGVGHSLGQGVGTLSGAGGRGGGTLWGRGGGHSLGQGVGVGAEIGWACKSLVTQSLSFLSGSVFLLL